MYWNRKIENGCFLSETVPHPSMGSVWYCSSAPLKCMLGLIPIAGIIQDPWKKTPRWILWRSHRKQQGKCSHPLWQSKHAKRASGVFLWVQERGHMWRYTLLHCRYTYLCMSTLLICTVSFVLCYLLCLANGAQGIDALCTLVGMIIFSSSLHLQSAYYCMAAHGLSTPAQPWSLSWPLFVLHIASFCTCNP